MANVFDEFDEAPPSSSKPKKPNVFDEFDEPQTPMRQGDAFIEGAKQGSTFGFNDEIQAARSAGTPEALKARPEVRLGLVGSALAAAGGGARILAEKIAPQYFGNEGGKAYDQTLQAEREVLKEAERQHPYTTMAGQVAGGVAMPMGAVRNAMQGLKVGAGIGAVTGFGSAEGGFENRMIGGASGAAFGGAIGAPLGAFAGRFTPKAAPEILPGAAAADDVGIPLTAGQRRADPALLSREDAALGGGLGEKAQRVAQQARADQEAAIQEVVKGVGTKAASGATLDRAAGAGEVTIDAVKRAAEAAKAKSAGLYDAAYAEPGVFAPEALQGAGSRIRESLFSRQSPVITDPILTPASEKMLSVLDKVSDLKLGSIGQPNAGDAVTGINMAGIDRARRLLTSTARAAQRGSEDARAAQAIIREFDGQVITAMENGLFSGSDDALKLLKDARGSYAEYAKQFKYQGRGDDAGAVIEKIISRDATPEQVANLLYGQAKIGASGTSVRLFDRLQTALSDQPEALNAIKAGLWMRLTNVADGNTPKGAQMLSQRINEFVSGDGATLARKMFSADELASFKQVAFALKQTVSPKGTANYSQSGNRASALMGKIPSMIAAGIGASQAGPVGLAAGAMTGAALKSFTDGRNARMIQQQFSGEAPISIGRILGEKMSGAAANAPRIAAPQTSGLQLPFSGPVRLAAEGEPEERNRR